MHASHLTQDADGGKDHLMFNKLIRSGLLTEKQIEDAVLESGKSGKFPEELLIQKGTPKHEVLLCISEYYGIPFVEYDEEIAAAEDLTDRMDMERLKQALWFPLSVSGDKAEVIAYRPDDSTMAEDIRRTCRVERIDFSFALPSDLIRIIENNQDLNPGFPPSGGRTPLAKVRTFLADRRSMLSCYRTSLAKARTGLAFLRTGISFIAIAIVLFRMFGIGYLSVIELMLIGTGVTMAADGLIWYLPSRKVGRQLSACAMTKPTGGTTVLDVLISEKGPLFNRSNPVQGADELRKGWDNLSPVMRRRFLAGDRTDLAEERTNLACYRTMMSRARTGLAFTRTGIAFIGLGIALFRQFPTGLWTVFDALVVCIGALMAIEGFYWYFPGRRAAEEGLESVQTAGNQQTIWDLVFPPVHQMDMGREVYAGALPVKDSYSPGIWGTTGLALERTLLAERRNVMARLRTIMARSRTGLAFIRTGMSISAIGMGLLVYFGTGTAAWMLFNLTLILFGLVLIADGLLWHIPAETVKRQFPYCFGDMEIMIPDYGKPARLWKKVVFSYDAE